MWLVVTRVPTFPSKLKSSEPTFETNCFVHRTNLAEAGIPLPLIGEDRGTGQDVLDDELLQRLLLSVRENEEEGLLRFVFP